MVLLAFLELALKAMGALRKPPPRGQRVFFWLSPLLAVATLGRVQPADTRRVICLFGRVACAVGCFLGAHWLLRRLAVHAGLTGPGPALSYVAAPLLWLGTGAFADLVRPLYLPFGRILPPVHDGVLGTRSLADFWGRRWNLWMSDWFRQVILGLCRRRPGLAVFAVFLWSGLIHEYVVNFGLWLVHGRNQFGSMLIYFGLQAGGLEFERAWLENHAWLRRIFAWVIVIGPVPLFLNEGLLRVLHFWF